MSQSIREYLREASETMGAAWNRWWFTSRAASTLSAVRIGIGLITLYWLATLSPDLQFLFGEDGLLPSGVVQQIAELTGRPSYSYLHVLKSPVELWVAHGAALFGVRTIQPRNPRHEDHQQFPVPAGRACSLRRRLHQARPDPRSRADRRGPGAGQAPAVPRHRGRCARPQCCPEQPAASEWDRSARS